MDVAINFEQISGPLDSGSHAFKNLAEKYKQVESTVEEKNAQIIRQKENESKMELSDIQAFKCKCSYKKNHQLLSCFLLFKLTIPEQNITLEKLNDIKFPVLAHPINHLLKYTKMIFEATPERKNIGKTFNLKRLLQLFAESYNIAAYHNFSHAFSVLLLIYQCYNRSQYLRKSLTEKQWFYVFIAALAHDLNHPSTTNAFEIKIKSQLAIDSGNQSVLQNMHIGQLWSILKKNSQVNFLQGYSSIQAQQIRKMITRLILATDVAKHFKGLETLKQIGKLKKPLEGETSMIVMEQVFHGCDIGNPCLDFQSYMNWGVLVSYQFDQVARKQHGLGVEVTQYMKYQNLSKYYNVQKGFCQNLVFPLWIQLDNILPGLTQLKENVRKNMQELQKRRQDEEYRMIF